MDIESLRDKLDNFEPSQCDTYSASCIVILEMLKHRSGVSMAVEGELFADYCLQWNRKPLTGGMKDTKQLTENAALAIAFFLALEETQYTSVEQSHQGTGIDYWLGYKADHPLFDEDNFMHARLEVSGIMNNYTEIERRKKFKHEQTKKSAFMGIPAYVIIAEFGTPAVSLTAVPMFESESQAYNK